MNRNDKPKLTSGNLIQKLKDEKGVTFKYIDEVHAEDFLKYRSFIFYCFQAFIDVGSLS